MYQSKTKITEATTAKVVGGKQTNCHGAMKKDSVRDYVADMKEKQGTLIMQTQPYIRK
jgi:hypothetical protein